jgi:glycosyltransferase involved in cell wall biosynthesis
MKILMTADTVGGVWQYALSLCGALANWGVEIVLATMGEALTPAQRSAVGRLPNVIVAESHFRLEWMAGADSDVAESGEWLAALAQRHQVELVHVNGYAHAAIDFGAPTLMVAHSDVLSWFRAVRKENAPAEWNVYGRRVREALARAACVVAPTDVVRGDLIRHFGRMAGPSLVIPNGIALDRYQPGAKRQVVLSVGRLWDQAKNIVQLDRIAPRVRWPIEVGGEVRDPDGGGAQGFANVIQLGVLPRPALEKRLAEAAIYAAPALYEPFGLAILEAAASGCALVLGDIPSLREIWEDAAIYVTPGDDDGLVAILNALIAAPAKRAAMAERARLRAGAFGIDRMAAQYAQLYLSLTRRSVLASA